ASGLPEPCYGRAAPPPALFTGSDHARSTAVPAEFCRFLRTFSFVIPLWSVGLCVQPASDVEAAPAATLYPASPHQGETLFVLLEPTPDVAGMRCEWDGAVVPVARIGGSVLATIGIGITERPGKHTLRLSYQAGTGGPRV